MSIAAQCSDCCTCPTPSVEWDARSASLNKCGWEEWPGYVSTPPKIYVNKVVYGSLTVGPAGTDAAAGWYYTDDGCTGIASGYNTVNGFTCSSVIERFDPQLSAGTYSQAMPAGAFRDCSNPDFGSDSSEVTPAISSATVKTWTASSPDTGSVTETLSDEYTNALLRTNLAAAIAALSWPGTWTGTPGSTYLLATNELSASGRQGRYRLRFKIPLIGTGQCYRALWVERFIPAAGVAIDSLEVFFPGVYRPAVTIAAPAAGGTQASAVAVMASGGGVASILILNPGSGYTSAPTVTVAAAINGGTTSTGWSATLNSSGQLTAITGGSGGNYLPQLSFSGGSGSGASAAVTLDARGGIAGVSFGSGGSGYTSEPTLTITARNSGATAADLLLHLGTETPLCYEWDGTPPSGYDPATPSTYPIIGDGSNPYVETSLPATPGTLLVANARGICDCTDCP